jgi:hypothetical protein
MAHEPYLCLSRQQRLVSQLHASQDQSRSQTQRLVSRIRASQDNNGSQANFMPLKTNVARKPTSRLSRQTNARKRNGS